VRNGRGIGTVSIVGMKTESGNKRGYASIAIYKETRQNTIVQKDSGRAEEGLIWKWTEKTLRGSILQRIACWRVIRATTLRAMSSPMKSS